MDKYEAYRTLGIEREVYDHCEKITDGLQERFRGIDDMAEINQMKVLDAFRREQVQEACLMGSTGYGYNDTGREVLERVYSDIFHTDDALVRPQITCGTHALALALMSNLRPGDGILSVSGRPYDTLEEVIGIRESKGSLKEYGITYDEVPLREDGSFDTEGIRQKIKKETKLIAIQRSKGYSDRRSFSVGQIGECIAFIRSLRPDLIIMVDNCYGEFVEDIEPTDVGADMAVGSLIKNPGGGLAPAGGYIAGRAECIENAARRLTSPGLGREVGATLGMMRDFYQGLFLAPTVTASALKGAIFAARLYGGLGFEVLPDGDEERYDIIQAVTFHREDALVSFCRGIQAASPVDSFVVPEPWAMPGYDSRVIMAAGSFISGSSIELSADGPIREPYSVYFQGGLTWPHARFGIMNSLQFLVRDGIVDRNKLRC
ncbi:MAG: methionine gamma-lyase family protein [Lachnospiraceae bacterium]|nr:methionine gamma-lyase family protein [Lachnospiraceae bacterium]